MTDNEAHKVVRDLRDVAVADCESISGRIVKLKEEYIKDQWEETAAQINRLQSRYEKRVKDAEALSIAVSKF